MGNKLSTQPSGNNGAEITESTVEEEKPLGTGPLGFLHPARMHREMRRSITKLDHAAKKQVPTLAFPSEPTPRMSSKVVCVDIITLALIVAVVYVGIVQARDIENMYGVSSAISNAVVDTSMTTKSLLTGDLNANYKLTFNDIQNTGDLTSYLFSAFVPQMFLDESASAEERASRRVFGDSVPASPIRFGASKVRNNTCDSIEVGMASDYVVSDGSGEYRPCWGSYSADNKLRDTFAGKYPYLEDGICSNPQLATHFLGFIDNYGCGRNAKDVYFNSTRQEVWTVLQELLDDNFLSPLDTRLFSIEFYIFTPATEVFARMSQMVEISSGGGFFSTFTVQFIRTQFSATFVRLFVSYGIIFVLLFVRLVWSFVHLDFDEFVRNISVDVFMAGTVVVLVILTGLEIGSDSLERTVFQIAQGNFSDTMVFHQSLSNSIDRFVVETWVIAFLVGMVVLKVLTLCRVSMRLYIFVLTFRSAFFKLMAILVLFVIGITGFAIAGVALFGSSVREFRTMGYAFNTLFQILLGSTDVYAKLRNVSIVASIFYFWAYIVVLLIVLLNLVVAVLIDSFENIAEVNRVPSIAEVCKRYARGLKFAAYFTIYGNSREFVFATLPRPTRFEIEIQMRLAPRFREQHQVTYPLVPASMPNRINKELKEALELEWWGMAQFKRFALSHHGLWREYHRQHADYNRALASATWKGDKDTLCSLLPNGCEWHLSEWRKGGTTKETVRNALGYFCRLLLRTFVLAPVYFLKTLWHRGKHKTHKRSAKFGQKDVSANVAEGNEAVEAELAKLLATTSKALQVRLDLMWAEICEEAELNVVVRGENEELKLYSTLKFVLSEKLPQLLARATDRARYDLRETLDPSDGELSATLNKAPFTFEEEWQNTKQRANVINHVREAYHRANDVASSPIFATVKKSGPPPPPPPPRSLLGDTWTDTWWQTTLASMLPTLSAEGTPVESDEEDEEEG